MSGPLNDSPAEIIRQLLVDLELATDPSDADNWPAYFKNHPDSPDSSICVLDTSGILQGREHIAGETQLKHGIQVRIRNETGMYSYGYQRASRIFNEFDGVLRASVTVNACEYLVQAIHNQSSIIHLGYSPPNSKRDLFTINAIASIRMISDEDIGTGS